MGLFGGIFKSVAGAIPVVGDLVQGVGSANAIGKASKAQIAASQQGINALNTQFAQSQENFAPWISGGQDALAEQLKLLGLGGDSTDWAAYVNANPDALDAWNRNQWGEQQQFGGDIAKYGQFHYTNDGSRRDLSGFTTNGEDSQQAAIDALKASPLFTSQYGQGLDAILQGAAATGGLRGGNTALAQSNFGASLLSDVIQKQLANLGGISANGQNAAGTIANLGANNAGAVAGLFGQQGAAKAGSITGQQAVWNNTSNNLQQSIASLIGGGGLKF